MSAAIERLPHADAYGLAERFIAGIADQCVHVEIAGSIRRHAPTCGDIEIVAVPATAVRYQYDLFGSVSGTVAVDSLASRMDRLACEDVVTKRRRADGTLMWGPSWKSFTFGGAAVDLFTPEQERYGWILALRTGPAAFSRQLVMPVGRTTADGRPGLLPPTIAPRDGWLTWGASGERIAVPTEREAFDLFGIGYIEPRART